jgi:hypothetical protein
LKERETLASTVTTLPSGMALLNARDLQMLLQQSGMSSLQYLPRDPFGLIHRQKDYSKGLFHLVKLNQ